MNEQKKVQAEKILDYWFALEFLSQDPFPNNWDVRSKVKKHKQEVLKGEAKAKTVSDFVILEGKENIYEVLVSEATACGMKKWGNLTFYIGRIKREKCIECIAEVLPFNQDEYDRPEKSTDKIAWVSLQLSPDGRYIDKSLSLSTIVWAMNQIKKTKGKISDSLDEQCYRNTVKELEDIFFSNEETYSQEKLEEAQVIEGEEEMQTFSPEAVSWKELHGLYTEIENRYIKHKIKEDNEENLYDEIYAVSFQLFADETIKEKRENDDYLGLSRNYYSDDIRFVLEELRNGGLEKSSFMGKDIIKYITVLEEEGKEKSDRIDLVNPKCQGKQEYLNQVNKILSVENAPLGKWPSKFMPAFMQQVAINLAIKKGSSDLFGVNGNIFSVNGPPGTGKTTLIKEIVVSNIIERAILLSKYEKPDDAFDEHDFLYGTQVNERYKSVYSKYITHWYSLKDDKINDYSMLVTSCNNAAVENISKELPKDMKKDLEPSENDSKELKNLLKSVSELFDVKMSNVCETTRDKETYQDIYFTKYAQNLFGENGSKVWGLIAAPLGKKSNINNFYYNVLNNLIWDFYVDKDMIAYRLSSYKKAKKQFEEQLKLVKNMQIVLKKVGDLIDEKAKAEVEEKQRCLDGNKAIEVNKKIIEKTRKVVSELEEEEKEQLNSVKSCEEIWNQEVEELHLKEEEIKRTKDKIKESLEKEIATRGSVGIITKLFVKAKYEAVMKLADEYKQDAEEQKQLLNNLEKEVIEGKEKIYHKELLVQQQKEKCQEIRIMIEKEKNIVSEKENYNKAIEKKINETREKTIQIQKKCQNEMLKFTRSEGIDFGVIIDEKFIEKILSENIEVATKAQVENPWFTQRYNREREKLFYYAMRLNKEFVLSSSHCRDNFNTLSQYWGLKMGDDNKKIKFHERDKEKFVPALFQTLFLLVPVLSSTFASVGTLMKDVKKPGSIGMLVVDEAGQAQPQMAIGALYRSRRAIIVGDPKQVEPVVTDDLSLLKKAYNDDILKPYKSKEVSVQGFADLLNDFGTYLDNGTDYPEWIGCPLLVHRRCISPMYDISNKISYNGIMKQQTAKPEDNVIEKFICQKSQWINVKGFEKGKKNHFVDEQGKKVCELLELAFSKSSEPNVYIISPFTTVVSGIRDYINKYCSKNEETTKINKEYILDYKDKKIGTVHTFQGKEANEVIFLLGCDASKEARGAIKWVNNNIVNVAVTRAKYRLYVIGDENAWRFSPCVSAAKKIIDTFAIREINSILKEELPEQEKEEALLEASNSLPSVTSFIVEEIEEDSGKIDYSVDTSGLIEEFIKTELSMEQLKYFGFENIKSLDKFSFQVKENLVLGMKLFYLLKPVYKVNKQLDASCCSILFCKAIELQMKDCFFNSMKTLFPDFKVKGYGKGRNNISLKDAKNTELTLGGFDMLLKHKVTELASRMKAMGKGSYDELWWKSFENKVKDCTQRRNQCCHSGLFSWKDQSFLLSDIFVKDGEEQKETRIKQIGGILFESEIGKALISR